METRYYTGLMIMLTLVSPTTVQVTHIKGLWLNPLPSWMPGSYLCYRWPYFELTSVTGGLVTVRDYIDLFGLCTIIPFDCKIFIYLAMYICICLHNCGSYMIAWESMYFPSPGGTLSDMQVGSTVVIVNHFIRVVAWSSHSQKPTFFDNLFNFLLYLKAKVCISPDRHFTPLSQHVISLNLRVNMWEANYKLVIYINK